ncbi:MAG: tryptophan 2,3-dioxygenase family protein [Holophagae bacterium]
MAVSYGSYLRLDELLALQQPLSDGPEHDETLFIVLHQVNELWFKQILHELKLLQLAMENGHAPIVSRTLKRVLTILTTLVAQIDVLETMTPMSFPSFRELLETASTFQSFQFLELQFVLGHRRPEIVDAFEEGGAERLRLDRLSGRPSVYDSFLRYLQLLGYPIPPDVLNRDLAGPNTASAAVQESLIEIYRHDPAAWQICELMVDLDEGLLEWRYRHMRMVERTIGREESAGGSAAALSLRSALSTTLFPDLWAIRSDL